MLTTLLTSTSLLFGSVIAQACLDAPVTNGIAFQDKFFESIVPTVAQFETPIALRALSAEDAAAFDCLATYSANVLASLTKQRPIIADSIPSNMHTTSNRILCSGYAYSTVWEHIMGREQLSLLQPLYDEYGLNKTHVEQLIDSVESCNNDLTCLSNLASTANYCPDTIGVIVGSQYNHWLTNDGWNQDGSSTPFGECTANCRPYSDPLGIYDTRVQTNPLYKTYNGAFRWRNLLEDNGKGFFYRQEHVTPHIGFVGKPKTLSRAALNARHSPHPNYNYKIESELVVKRVEHLAENDFEKANVEVFDNKIAVDTFVLFAMDAEYNLNWEQRISFALGVTSAEYDSVLASWKEKVRYNLIRPTTTIQSGKFTSNLIKTWGGPFQGEKTIRTQDFQPYIRVMPHAEYPSGSGCICRVLYEFTDAFIQDQYGNDSIAITMPFPSPLQPSSSVEPGAITPQVIQLSNMEELYERCGESRLWGGMHFTAAINGAEKLCEGMGIDTYAYLVELLNGADLQNISSL